MSHRKLLKGSRGQRHCIKSDITVDMSGEYHFLFVALMMFALRIIQYIYMQNPAESAEFCGKY